MTPSNGVYGCDFFASIEDKGTFADIAAAIAHAAVRDIILLGNQAAGKRLHISQAHDVAITSNCNITIDSIHLQKSKNVSLSKLSVMPSAPDVHAIMLQGSAFLNENIAINEFKISGQNGGVDGIHIGPHNKNVSIFSTIVTSFQGNGVKVHKNNVGVELHNSKILKNNGYGVSVDGNVEGYVRLVNNQIERNGTTGLALGEGLQLEAVFNKIVANGQIGEGYGVLVASNKPSEVDADKYVFESNTIIGNKGQPVQGKSTSNFGNYHLAINANDKNNIIESNEIPQTIDGERLLDTQQKYLFSDDNVTISVPMSENYNGITVTPLQSNQLSGEEANTLVPGLAYEFGPSGRTFNDPIEIVLKYDAVKLASLGISDPSKIYLKVYDPVMNLWKLTSTIHDDEAKVIIGYVFHFSRYAYGYSDPQWPALDPNNVPPRPLRFPNDSARPPKLRDGSDSGDLLVIDYPWAQTPNGCSLMPEKEFAPSFSPVCNQHDQCYYTYRGTLNGWELSKDAWNKCNWPFTRDLTAACNPFYIREQRKIKTIKDVWGAIVEVFEIVFVRTPASVACVKAAEHMAFAVDAAAVLPEGTPPCPEGGCYTAAQKKQLEYQDWLAKVVRPPHCTVSGTPDKIKLTIDSWEQQYGVDDDPYFELRSGLSAPGVTLSRTSYNTWEGMIDRLGDFEFVVKNLFTDAQSKCGVIISEIPPELLPDGIIDVAVTNGDCPPGYDIVQGDLNAGAGGAFVHLCTRHGKNVKMVTDVKFVGGPHWLQTCPDGYFTDPNDLNEGAGGWFIHLCKKTDTVLDSSVMPLQDLHVYSSREAGNQCPSDYEWVNFDLNEGAEGRFVYLCKK